MKIKDNIRPNSTGTMGIYDTKTDGKRQKYPATTIKKKEKRKTLGF